MGYRSWRLQEFPKDGVSLWFNLFIKWSTLESQDRKVEISVRSPTLDAERRKGVLTRHLRNLRLDGFRLPTGKLGDYLMIAAYVATSETPRLSSNSIVLAGVDKYVIGWPDGSEFALQPKRFELDGTSVIIAIGSPVGELRQDLTFALPRTRSG